MAAISRAYTFTDGTDAYGSQVENEFNTVFNAWNNHDAGTSSWTYVKVSNDMTNSGAGKGYVCTTPDGLHTVRLSVSNLDANNLSSVTTEVVT